jgi:hypothetical protein
MASKNGYELYYGGYELCYGGHELYYCGYELYYGISFTQETGGKAKKYRQYLCGWLKFVCEHEHEHEKKKLKFLGPLAPRKGSNNET